MERIAGQILEHGAFVSGVLVLDGAHIAALEHGPAPGDVFVAPGLVELQTNGGFGFEVDGRPSSIVGLARALPRTGVTSFFPTFVSSEAGDYEALFEAFRDASATLRTGAKPYATPVALHLEGPFLSDRAVGAHRIEAVRAASLELVLGFAEESAVGLVTLAPERPGALEAIGKLARRGRVVSLGHSSGSYDEWEAGASAGATLATHVFNAMTPLHHRAPGAVGSALANRALACGVIADGVHVHPGALKVVLAAKGWERIALVTDAMAAAGQGPGSYALGGRPVWVDAVSARTEDGALAGSTLTLDRAIHNMHAMSGCSFAQALAMASEVPGRIASRRGGEALGALVPGGSADVTIWDAERTLVRTITRGITAYERAPS